MVFSKMILTQGLIPLVAHIIKMPTYNAARVKDSPLLVNVFRDPLGSGKAIINDSCFDSALYNRSFSV